jgi:hypothetical protein
MPSPTEVAAVNLPRGALAEVTIESLDVRLEPDGSAELVDIPEGNPIALGGRVLIVGDPFAGRGSLWYPVGFTDMDASPPVGWVSAGTAAAPSLRVDDHPCPDASLGAIAGLSAIQRLGCYGSSSLTFAAHQAATPPDIGFLPPECPEEGPMWLACTGGVPNWVNDDGGTGGLLMLYFDPATKILPTGLAPVGKTGPGYEIQGHFNDPSSVGCTSGAEPGSVQQMESWLGCASRFVVERLTLTR